MQTEEGKKRYSDEKINDSKHAVGVMGWNDVEFLFHNRKSRVSTGSNLAYVLLVPFGEKLVTSFLAFYIRLHSISSSETNLAPT